MRLLYCCILLAALLSAVACLAPPQFTVDLDAPPEQRFVGIISHFNSSLQTVYNDLITDDLLVLSSAISQKRGPELDPEQMREIAGLAKLTGFPFHLVHTVQMLYELQTLMFPILNLTSLFGCTGILARYNNSVLHARNMDFMFAKYLSKLVYNAVFTKKGAVLYESQMIALYGAPITGMRRGSNAFGFEINSRFADHIGGNVELFKNLFYLKRPLSYWIRRKLFEQIDNYDTVVQRLSDTPFAAPEYIVLSGNNKGVILARNPATLAYKIELAKKRYIIVTNFDYIYNDVREWFDPTSVNGIGNRRVAATKILDKHAITPHLLLAVLNDPGVMAKDTIFQALINVKHHSYQAFLPACVNCGT